MLCKPVMGGISAPYGYSPGYLGGRVKHNGIDFFWLYKEQEASRRVYSAHPGTVTDAGYSSQAGNYVLVDIGGGYKVRYIHLSQIAVKVGQRVGYSTFLGVMGDTGTATAPGQIHLHMDLFKGTERVNPAPYLVLPFGYGRITPATTETTPIPEPETENDMAKIIHDKDKGGYWLVTAIDYLELASSVAADLYPTFGDAVLVSNRQRIQTLAVIDTIRSNRRKEFSSDGSVADLVTKLDSIFK